MPSPYRRDRAATTGSTASTTTASATTDRWRNASTSATGLAFTILGAPIRGAERSRLRRREVYDLVGNNYYNPNWGYQDGKKRNARVRNNHEPLMVVNYTNTPDDRTKIDAAASFRFGTNGYSALTWKGGADPRPDYYRNLPSYYMANNQFSNAAQIAELWRTSYDTRQINWDRLYDTNYRGEIDEGTYGAGHRSNYMIEERHTDQLDLNLTARSPGTFRDNSRLVAGILYRWNPHRILRQGERPAGRRLLGGHRQVRRARLRG